MNESRKSTLTQRLVTKIIKMNNNRGKEEEIGRIRIAFKNNENETKY